MTGKLAGRLSIFLLCGVVLGCGGADYNGEKRFPLTGKVTFDGQPIEWGSIAFIPQSGNNQRVSGSVIQNGVYDVPEAKGANAGKHRVEIHWLKPTGKKIQPPDSEDIVDERVEALPPKFHAQSELSAEISGDNTRFDFDLKSN